MTKRRNVQGLFIGHFYLAVCVTLEVDTEFSLWCINITLPRKVILVLTLLNRKFKSLKRLKQEFSHHCISKHKMNKLACVSHWNVWKLFSFALSYFQTFKVSDVDQVEDLLLSSGCILNWQMPTNCSKSFFLYYLCICVWLLANLWASRFLVYINLWNTCTFNALFI